MELERRVPFFKKFCRSPSLLSLTLSPLSSLLSPMWQKLPYICNNFFHYSNLRITFLNYCTIEKSPSYAWTPFLGATLEDILILWLRRLL